MIPLLADLAARGIALAARDGRIAARPAGALTTADREAIKAATAEIHEYLAAQLPVPHKETDLVALPAAEGQLKTSTPSYPRPTPGAVPPLPKAQLDRSLPRAWDAETLRLIAWLEGITAADLPPAPFWLHTTGTRLQVIDGVRFLEALRADLARGPAGPRARNGTLQQDLADLETALRDRQ
ncbi:MAG: hypothetical protein KGR26_03725 [Cyanobacteria bacterium REEB65]|nr:hypothetical protein [Cyanobacteria bacterium REEB65]